MHSYSITFHIPQAALPHVVGKGGAKVAALRSAHRVQIDITDDPSTSPPSTRVTIEGAHTDVKAAQAKVLETVTDTIHVQTIHYPLASHLHKHIIGPAGQRIRQIVDAAGGPDKAKVQFPEVGVAEGANEVMLKGSHPTLQILKAEIEKAVQDFLGHKSVDVEVLSRGINGSSGGITSSIEESGESIEHRFSIPSTEIPHVVGRNGETARALMKKHNVIVFVDGADVSGQEDVPAQLKIVGKRDSDIEAAKAEIISKLRTTVNISLTAPILEAFRTDGPARDVNIACMQELAKKLKSDLNVLLEMPSSLMKGSSGGVSDGELSVKGGENLQAALKEVQKFLNDLVCTIHIKERFGPFAASRQLIIHVNI